MKKLISLLLVFTLLAAASIPAFADTKSEPVVYGKTFTVTAEGGTFQVGFVKVEFKKNFMGVGMAPMTFTAKVFAVNGQGCIEFSPDVASFVKDVKIKVGPYKGALYDEVLGRNIQVDFKPQIIIASHFSRYCWN